MFRPCLASKRVQRRILLNTTADAVDRTGRNSKRQCGSLASSWSTWTSSSALVHWSFMTLQFWVVAGCAASTRRLRPGNQLEVEEGLRRVDVAVVEQQISSAAGIQDKDCVQAVELASLRGRSILAAICNRRCCPLQLIGHRHCLFTVRSRWLP